ncbi:hypothetical protein K9M16_02195 [Candidatus Babeliales bacterium]|nr:hypothetical protein [Candidatus Babeliales bacterium]
MIKKIINSILLCTLLLSPQIVYCGFTIPTGISPEISRKEIVYSSRQKLLSAAETGNVIQAQEAINELEALGEKITKTINLALIKAGLKIQADMAKFLFANYAHVIKPLTIQILLDRTNFTDDALIDILTTAK